MSAKIGRNDPCSCGSGLKYKKCCMDEIESLARKAAQEGNAEKNKTATPVVGKALSLSGEGSNLNPGAGDGFDDTYNDDYDFDGDDENYYNGDDIDEEKKWTVMKAFAEYRKQKEILKAKMPDELFAELNKLGLPVTREMLTADAVGYDSAVEMCCEWQKRYRQIKTFEEENIALTVAQVLWEKLDPAGTPCIETIFDEIAEGYMMLECEGDNDAALELWLAVWDKMKASLGRISRAFDDIDRQIPMPEGGLEGWALDMCELFANMAYESGGDEYDKRQDKFVAEFISAFCDLPADIAAGLKCERAERLFEDEKAAEADAVFEKIAAEYPCCHLVYKRWAYAYTGDMFDEDDIILPDLEKARRIIERGLAVESIDNRFELLDVIRDLNHWLLKAGRLAGAELDAARAAAEFEKKYKRAPLAEKLNMLDELCIGNALRSFERFVEPVHFYEQLAMELVDAGMLDRALGLAAILQLRQPALYEYHFVVFEFLNVMVKLSKGDATEAARIIERLLDDELPHYEYIVLIIKAAAAAGMEKAVGAQCLAAAQHYFKYNFHEKGDYFVNDRFGGVFREKDDYFVNDRLGDVLKYMAMAFIFDEACAKYEAGECIDEKDLKLKLMMIGWCGASAALTKYFIEEIDSGCASAQLDENLPWDIETNEFFETLFRASLRYFKRMRAENGRGFIMSSLVWDFVIDFLTGRSEKSRLGAIQKNFFNFDKRKLKDFAFNKCRSFGAEIDELPNIAANLKLMKGVFEHLRDCGALDDKTCSNAAAAAEWTLAKLLARYPKRAWQTRFIERLF